METSFPPKKKNKNLLENLSAWSSKWRPESAQ